MKMLSNLLIAPLITNDKPFNMVKIPILIYSENKTDTALFVLYRHLLLKKDSKTQQAYLDHEDQTTNEILIFPNYIKTLID